MAELFWKLLLIIWISAGMQVTAFGQGTAKSKSKKTISPPTPQSGSLIQEPDLDLQRMLAPPVNRVPETRDPVALMVVAPYYKYEAFKNPDEVIEPILELSDVLAWGRHQVRILVGNSETTDAGEGFRKIRERVAVINEAIEVENQDRKRWNLPRLYPVELSEKRFENAETLSKIIRQWMREFFSGKRRAPFGTLAFRGHGEWRHQLGHFFLTPDDEANRGGLGLDWLSREAIGWRAPLQVYWDICQSDKVSRDKGGKEISTGEKADLPVQVAFDQTGKSLPDIFQQLRHFHGRRFEWNTYPCNVFFPCFKTQEILTHPKESACHAIAMGLRLNETPKHESELCLKVPLVNRAAQEASEANLYETFSHLQRTIVTDTTENSSRILHPERYLGPISEQVVVYSRRKDYQYKPVDIPLFNEDAGKEEGVISITKDGRHYVFKKEVLKKDEDQESKPLYAVLVLDVNEGQEGIVLDQSNLWLELVLCGEGLEEKGAIEYRIQPGQAIQAGGTTRKILSSAAATDRRLTKNNVAHRVFSPLDNLKMGDSLEAVAIFAMKWQPGASIRLLSLRVVTDEEKKRIAGKLSDVVESKPDTTQRWPVLVNPKASLELLNYWWPDVFLRRELSVEVNCQASSPKTVQPVINVSGRVEEAVFRGGIEGPISPGAMIDQDHHRLHVKVKRNTQQPDLVNSKIGLILYSQTGVLCEHEIGFEKDAIDRKLEFANSGLVEFFSIALLGCREVKLESIKIVPK